MSNDNHTLINLLTGEVLTTDAVAEIHAADPGFVAKFVTALGRWECVPGLLNEALKHYGEVCERCRSRSGVRAVETGEMLCLDCRIVVEDPCWAYGDASFDRAREDGRRW